MTQGWDKKPNPPNDDSATSGYPAGAGPNGAGPNGAGPNGAGPYGAGPNHGLDVNYGAGPNYGAGQPPVYPAPAGYPPPAYPPAGQPSWAQQAYAQGAYSQPGAPLPGQQPPTGYPQPVYPPTAYQQPGAQPGYGPPPYPMAPQKPRKPGVVTAAAVLAFVQAGLLLIAGIATLNGGTALSDLDLGITGRAYSGVLTTMGVLTLASAGLLIAGGVSAFNKRPWLMVAGAALSLALSVWWVVQFDVLGFILTWALLLAVMPIISLSLILSSTAKNWMKSTT